MPKSLDLLNEVAAQETSTLEYLVQTGVYLSTEASSLPFMDAVSSSFSDFMTGLNGFIATLKVGNFQPRKVDATGMLGVLTARSYQDNRALYVTTQPGFTGKWLPYLKFLTNVILPAAEQTEASLKTSITKIAALLNEPDRLKAQSGIRELEKSVTLVSYADYQALKAYFNGGTKHQQRLGDVVDRNADITQSYQMINDLNVSLSRIDFARIKELLDRLAELTSTLKQTVQTDASRELSGMIARQLSELFYKLGITLTTGALLMDGVLMQTQAMIDTNDSILRQISP